MNRTVPVFLTVVLLLASCHIVNADVILLSGTVSTRADGELFVDGGANYHTVDSADIGMLAEVNSTRNEGVLTAHGASAANPYAALSIAGATSNFNYLTAPVASTSSASLSSDSIAIAYAEGRSDSQGTFQVTTPTYFRLTVHLDASVDTDTDANSSPSSQITAKYWLTGGPDNRFIYGVNHVEVTGNSSSVASGTHYVDSNIYDGYQDLIEVFGQLQPGNYAFESKIEDDFQYITGYHASGEGLASQSYILELSSVPEPGSLTLVGLSAAGLAGAWWRKRRKGIES